MLALPWLSYRSLTAKALRTMAPKPFWELTQPVTQYVPLRRNRWGTRIGLLHFGPQHPYLAEAVSKCGVTFGTLWPGFP